MITGWLVVGNGHVFCRSFADTRDLSIQRYCDMLGIPPSQYGSFWELQKEQGYACKQYDLHPVIPQEAPGPWA